MHGATFKLPFSATEESQLRIRPIPAVPDPTAEKFILPGDPYAAEVSANVKRRSGDREGTIRRILAKSRQAFESVQQFAQGSSQWKIEFLVRIETQNPISGCLVDCRILLRGEALPFFDEHFFAKRFRNLDRAVGRSGIDDDYFSFAVGHQGLHAGERAAEVGFFVEGNDHDGKIHRGVVYQALGCADAAGERSGKHKVPRLRIAIAKAIAMLRSG